MSQTYLVARHFEEDCSHRIGIYTCVYVAVNLQTLEYSGRGKSIHDVGLAQAKYPLDTMNHYFEIEIIDPGESCYIAIGVARRVSITHITVAVSKLSSLASIIVSSC